MQVASEFEIKIKELQKKIMTETRRKKKYERFNKRNFNQY